MDDPIYRWGMSFAGWAIAALFVGLAFAIFSDVAPEGRWTRICEDVVQTETRPNGSLCVTTARMCRQPDSFDYTQQLGVSRTTCSMQGGQ